MEAIIEQQRSYIFQLTNSMNPQTKLFLNSPQSPSACPCDCHRVNEADSVTSFKPPWDLDMDDLKRQLSELSANVSRIGKNISEDAPNASVPMAERLHTSSSSIKDLLGIVYS